ncbi:MAG: cob(I)yrinic acid a,c-diamide adenosyltransferase [Marinilabiliales bacterium]|nr:MAG: cob(I)yrinic acid a,c-diamide adenosyltransferase [Marinilabiliales bacterium]
MNSGLIHIYSGNGKGKTTAALGLALRAAGAGKKVLFSQFVKGLPYSEHNILKQIPGIDLRIFGRDCFIEKDPEPEDIEAAKNGFEHISEHLQHDKYDIIILDEINIALYFNLLSANKVINALQSRKTMAEIIITGRYPPDSLVEIADLHTEMLEHKHYYNLGVKARKGIEF